VECGLGLIAVPRVLVAGAAGQTSALPQVIGSRRSVLDLDFVSSDESLLPDPQAEGTDEERAGSVLEIARQGSGLCPKVPLLALGRSAHTQHSREADRTPRGSSRSSPYRSVVDGPVYEQRETATGGHRRIAADRGALIA
jgi:hypothetical protein